MKLIEVFLTALKLGLISFGGPIAHLGYFYDEYVKKKKWISDHAYADLVALCQFLPGPASSQVGMAIGFSRAGISGAILSWAGFTLPSAVLLVIFGFLMIQIDTNTHQYWIHALKVVSVAIVAQAVFNMSKKLCPDKQTAIIAIVSSLITIFISSPFIQVIVLFVAGLYGLYFLKPKIDSPHEPVHQASKKVGAIFIIIFAGLLFTLPLLRPISQELKLFDSFYRAGSLVFGGGHVVLPLLQAEVVPTGWVTNDLFMAGYGAANAIPGPLFAFSAYLGAVSVEAPNGWIGAFICLTAIFLPSFFLIVGVLPFWEKLRSISKIRQSMLGLNAAVVGLLLGAFYNPVWTSAIFSFKDFTFAAISFLLLEFGKLPTWALVVMGVGASFIVY